MFWSDLLLEAEHCFSMWITNILDFIASHWRYNCFSCLYSHRDKLLVQPVSFRRIFHQLMCSYWVNDAYYHDHRRLWDYRKGHFEYLYPENSDCDKIYMNNIIWFGIWYYYRNPKLFGTSECLAQQAIKLAAS